MSSFLPVRRTSDQGARLLMLLLLLGVAMDLQGCRRRHKEEKTEGMQISSEGQARPASAKPEGSRLTDGEQLPGAPLRVVYYDFDKSDLRADQLSTMDANLKYMKDNPDQKVLIEGHCDERGTTEYNFALGERRARAAMNYLTSGGIAADRIQVLSKGEEQPVDSAHSEAAWAKNRRAEFKAFK